jgi:hypothetical protein
MYSGYVRVTQAGLQLYLAHETAAITVGADTASDQDFHGFGPMGEAVLNTEDFSHPALTQCADDPIGIDNVISLDIHGSLEPATPWRNLG